ncbi:MAG: [FeFe] hydrogenase H-cluster radical SAM maturase HydG [Clostridiales bacterium]|nr:[FeFe] hydrogenase H-cluster radical SAM maturase HydG [Clostridiales bacterium]
MFIDHKYIEDVLEKAKHTTSEEIVKILDKAESFEGLTHREVASLLMTNQKEYINRMYSVASKIKNHIYGNRIVMFAPLYVSDYCINNCKYCGYNCKNHFQRRRLTMDEIRTEVAILEKMGHKRLALEAGEDPKNCSIDYIIDCIETIYDTKLEHGEIRRVNINIAATTVENYRRINDIGIGTYILFQETYHRPTYEDVHISGPKSDYDYHLTAFDRAMEAGIDDVGGGALFGLYDPYFEVLGLMLHNEHLEKKYGVGFHTISVPRIRPAKGVDLSFVQHLVDDETFKKIVAIIRLAVPFTGMIISTRESIKMRKELLNIGISQVSAGSTVEVGGYDAQKHKSTQFEVVDNRSAADVVKWLMDEGFIPSFCTSCYRMGRTGDRFMDLAKSGEIKNVCHPNALMTLYEYMLDYGDEDLKTKVEAIMEREIAKIQDKKIKDLVVNNINKLKEGKRDVFL